MGKAVLILRVDADTKLFGLIGCPVSKSLSPFIHNFVFDKMELNCNYMAFEIEKEFLDKGIDSLKTLGARGFNATIPHKISLLEWVDEIDPYAQKLQAINTVKIEKGKLIGYNTDGPGLIEVLKAYNIQIEESNILILGAGGAARGIAMALALNHCHRIGILNRTELKSEELANAINQSKLNTLAKVVSTSADLKVYDVVINTTSVGMYPHVDETPIDIKKLSQEAYLFDIVYKPHRTKFLQEGEKNGNPIIYGIEMLIYQALIAEEIWHDMKLDKKHLRNELIELALELKLLI